MTSQYSCKYKATNMAAMADVCEYKIVLLGDPGVGKTTWFLRIKQGEFVDTENHQTVSMGVEHLEHKITVQGKDGPKEVKVQACGLILLRMVTSRRLISDVSCLVPLF